MTTIRTVTLGACLVYGAIALLFVPAIRGQETTREDAIQTQQIIDLTRRVAVVEATQASERLARMEVKLEQLTEASERNKTLLSSVLLCMFGLIGEAVIRVIERRRKSS